MNSFVAGKQINQGYFKSFQPNLINRSWQIDDMSVLQLLSKADRFLGRLDMYSEYVNIQLYLDYLVLIDYYNNDEKLHNLVSM